MVGIDRKQKKYYNYLNKRFKVEGGSIVINDNAVARELNLPLVELLKQEEMLEWDNKIEVIYPLSKDGGTRYSPIKTIKKTSRRRKK